MTLLENIIRQMAQLGVADVILPFFLVFVLVFAVLQKIELFGARATTKPIHVVLGLVVGSAVVFMHILNPGSPFNVVPMIGGALPWVSGILVILLSVFLIINIFMPGSKVNKENGFVKNWLLPVVGLIVVYIFFAANDMLYVPPWFRVTLGYGWTNIIIAILVFGAIVFFITRNPKPELTEEQKAQKKAERAAKALLKVDD